MPFMEFLRGKIGQVTVGAYAEVEIRTPVSRTEELAMLIHMIECKLITVPIVAGAVTRSFCHLCDRPSTEIRGIEEPECLFHHLVFTDAEAMADTSKLVQFLANEIRVQLFNPAILYAKDAIYLGVNNENTPISTTATVRIGYTLERVSSKDFIAALID